MLEIKLADEFTTTPGGRFVKDGPYSGEQFRKEKLEPVFRNKEDQEIVELYLDGAEGYPSSFLEEAFGGLVRAVGDKEEIKKRLKLNSENKVLINEIKNYIEKA